MPKTVSRLRRAKLRQDSVQVVHDPKSAARSENAKNSRGHDERGNYGKGPSNPDSEDTYKDKC